MIKILVSVPFFLLSDTMKNVWQEYDKGVQKGEKELKKGI